MYDSSLKAKWDYKNSIAFAREVVMEEIEHKNALEIARKFKKLGLAHCRHFKRH